MIYSKEIVTIINIQNADILKFIEEELVQIYLDTDSTFMLASILRIVEFVSTSSIENQLRSTNYVINALWFKLTKAKELFACRIL